jgi:prephenate dehydrogenase
MRFPRVAIVGLGLLGGSLALALRRRHPGSELLAADRHEVIETALGAGVVDRGDPEPLPIVRDADLVILAGPVSAIVEQLSLLAASFRPGSLVTDVGSTKRRILEAARGLPREVSFIGGHPMAGKSASGLSAAEAGLFEGAPWALVPREETPLEALQDLSDLVSSLGARPIVIDALSHDRATAVVSHLPQVLALVLCQQAAAVERALDLPGPTFLSLARLASSPLPVWKDVIESNQDFVRQALIELSQRLQEAASELTPNAMSSWFETARQALARRTPSP